MATETLMMTDRLVLSPETGADPPIGASVSESSPPILLQEPPHEVNEFSLSAADGGKDAWLFLATSFVLEAVVWGFPFAFGVFQDYYNVHEDFSSAGIAAIGTTALGIMYLAMPLVMAILRLYPRFARWSPLVGLITMSIALASSSFSTATSHLVLTQGILYAIGGCLAYNPCLLYMPEWFVRRRGLACGIMWAGTGMGGFIFPILFEWLLAQYGFRTTLRIWSIGLSVIAPLTFFLKPRLPISASIHLKPYKLGFILQPTFLVFMIPTIIQSMGFFLPALYLPGYARSALGTGSFDSTLTVILINVSSTIGLVILGTLADRLHVTTCILISSVGAALGTLFLWGFSVNIPLLYVYCIVYGFFAGSYVASWPRIMESVVNAAHSRPGSHDAAISLDPIMVLSLLASARGVGNLLSGPLSDVMVHGSPWVGQSIGAWGSGYGPLVVFTGITAALGGGSIFWRSRIV